MVRERKICGVLPEGWRTNGGLACIKNAGHPGHEHKDKNGAVWYDGPAVPAGITMAAFPAPGTDEWYELMGEEIERNPIGGYGRHLIVPSGPVGPSLSDHELAMLVRRDGPVGPIGATGPRGPSRAPLTRVEGIPLLLCRFCLGLAEHEEGCRRPPGTTGHEP